MRWTDVLRIDAPAEVVWRLTTDLDGLSAVMPTVRRSQRMDSGPVRVGSCARLTQPGGLSAVWTVVELDEGRRFVWRARLLGRTLTAVHLIEPDAGGCRNTVALELPEPSTALARLMTRVVAAPVVRCSLRLENRGFAAAAERAVAG